jgi:hypothetical protein
MPWRRDKKKLVACRNTVALAENGTAALLAGHV